MSENVWINQHTKKEKIVGYRKIVSTISLVNTARLFTKRSLQAVQYWKDVQKSRLPRKKKKKTRMPVGRERNQEEAKSKSMRQIMDIWRVRESNGWVTIAVANGHSKHDRSSLHWNRKFRASEKLLVARRRGSYDVFGTRGCHLVTKA